MSSPGSRSRWRDHRASEHRPRIDGQTQFRFEVENVFEQTTGIDHIAWQQPGGQAQDLPAALESLQALWKRPQEAAGTLADVRCGEGPHLMAFGHQRIKPPGSLVAETHGEVWIDDGYAQGCLSVWLSRLSETAGSGSLVQVSDGRLVPVPRETRRGVSAPRRQNAPEGTVARSPKRAPGRNTPDTPPRSCRP